ncbi:MAG: hypothetical protein Q9204_009170 [Flavoplaca sp. TL-2023a]
MLIEESHKDVPTKADGEGEMRVFLFHPKIPNYPHARFPGVVLFSEIYQGSAFSLPWNGTANPMEKNEVQLLFGFIALS